MRVVHLNITEKFGGAAKAANRLHKELIRQGIDSKMLVLKKETNDPNVIEASSLYSLLDKGELFFRKALNKFRRLIRKHEHNYDNRSLLFSVLKRLDFDIIHLHWITNGYVNFNEIKDDSWKIIWTMHDCAAFTGICHVIGSCKNYITQCGRCPLIKSLEKKDVSNKAYLQKSKFYKKHIISFVSPSNWLASTASESPLLSDNTITIIPHGLDIEKYSPINKSIAKGALKKPDDIKIILCGAVTLDDENKGVIFLSEALKYIKENFISEQKIEIIFFGDSTEGTGNFPFKTTYLGYLHDELLLRICYSAADVVVLPSKQESFGLIAIEAMACGTPVVAFGATGMLDIIDHEENGYLAKPYDSIDLAQGIKWCMENSKNSNLSERTREKVVSSFKIESTTLKYIDHYRKILDDK